MGTVFADGRDVRVSGGADVFQQCLRARVVDELHVHVAPVLLGIGVRLFDNLSDAEVKLEAGPVAASPRVAHLMYRVVR
jgi:dihydrofolate reductase